jgi:glycosyltransferase involved in cell wall biosynthesis
MKAALYGGAAARVAGLPVVWHLHDRIAGDYLPEAAVRLVRGAARILPTHVIANSRATLQTIAPYVRSSEAIPCCLPAGALQRPRLSPTRRHRRALCVGMVGRLVPWKGQHVFLEAFARAFGANSAQAVLVGGAFFGEEAYEYELRKLAERLGIYERVRFTGFCEDVNSELAGLDILVHASVIPEPFGQTVVEGMAAGLPVIAADAGGPAEIIEHDTDGLLYPPGDIDALAAMLRRVAHDERLRERLGTAARDSAGRYASDVVAPAVLSAYRTTLTRRAGRLGGRIVPGADVAC